MTCAYVDLAPCLALLLVFVRERVVCTCGAQRGCEAEADCCANAKWHAPTTSLSAVWRGEALASSPLYIIRPLSCVHTTLCVD